MKNVNKDQLKHAILLSKEEFAKIVKELFGNLCDVDIDYNDNTITLYDRETDDYVYLVDVYPKLAEYFDVTEITSIHCQVCYDDEDFGDAPVLFWICYKGEDATVSTAIEQTLDADDVDERCEQIAETFFESIDTDDEPRDRCGRYMLKAIAENSVDDLLIAICGWSAASLMKKANIMRDTDSMFHQEIEDATFVSIWNGERHEVKTDCKVNTETFEVFDIEEPPRIIKEMLDDATLDGEYVGLDGVRYPVVRKEQLPDGDIISFWRK